VVAAGSGQAGLEFVDTAEFELVVVAAQMSGLDGPEVVDRIRCLGRLRIRRVPILAIVEDVGREARATLGDAGFDGVLARPVDDESLDREIVRHFREPAPDFVPDRALAFLRGDEGRLRAVLTEFVEDAPVRMTVMRGALGTRDAPALGLSAHSLEDTAHQLAMPRIRDLSHRIAAHSRRGELNEAARLVRELEDAVRRCRSAARSVIGAA